MPETTVGAAAPRFELPDYAGRRVALADYIGNSHVLLVLNRGLA
jgi:peroxiredoxin